MTRYIRKIASWLLPDAYKPFTMFPYPFVGEPLDVKLGIGVSDLPYAEFDGVCIFFPKDFSLKEVEVSFRGYLEDEGLTGYGRRKKSPHCYVSDDHYPEFGDVIVDIGCSEGFFSRSFADRAKKIFLFEAEEKWQEPLIATFEGYSEKVVRSMKFVGSKSDTRSVRLEEVVEGDRDDVYFMKLDVEGAEREILESSYEFLCNHKIKMSCCSYHRQDDGRYLTKLLQSMGYKTTYSDGWMLLFGGNMFPYLRRGVIYARNF